MLSVPCMHFVRQPLPHICCLTAANSSQAALRGTLVSEASAESGAVTGAHECPCMGNMYGVLQAGMVTKLAARTSVLAAMNPVAQYDPERPLEANTGLPAPLLSRFDVVLALVDGVNATRCATCRHSRVLMTRTKPEAGIVAGNKQGHHSHKEPPAFNADRSCVWTQPCARTQCPYRCVAV